jgi:hypothetical protein
LAGKSQITYYVFHLFYSVCQQYRRDDRCVSDHGREVWFPYLDEEMVSFIQSVPLSIVSGFQFYLQSLLLAFTVFLHRSLIFHFRQALVTKEFYG